MSESAMTPDPSKLPTLTSQIVSAYVAHNRVATETLPSLIQQVHHALANAGEQTSAAVSEMQQPAVQVRRSVFPDHIVCLEDGKKLKMLKRHLQTAYGMTPQQYRAKWGLPHDYPMVAPALARRRSELARQIGRGRKPTATEQKVSRLPARRAKGSKG